MCLGFSKGGSTDLDVRYISKVRIMLFTLHQLQFITSAILSDVIQSARPIPLSARMKICSSLFRLDLPKDTEDPDRCGKAYDTGEHTIAIRGTLVGFPELWTSAENKTYHASVSSGYL